MFPHLSIGELLVLLLVVMLIFGPQRLPEVAASFGKAIKSFKEGLREDEEQPKREPSPKS